MNTKELGNLLRNSPETSVTVGDRLHQDIMRSVRLAGTAESTRGFAWAGPALGGALAVMLIAVLQFSQPGDVQNQQPVLSGKAGSTAALQALGDSLKGISNDSLLTENELELEIERLKSDLKRFDFRS